MAAKKKRVSKKATQTPGVGKKVKKLKAEGKTQAQAIAISLHMAEENRLSPKGGYRRVAKKKR